MRYIAKLLAISGMIFLAGCASNTVEPSNEKASSDLPTHSSEEKFLGGMLDMFPFAENGPFEIPSDAQVCGARKKLAKVNSGTPLSRQAKGEILFEGTLLAAHEAPAQKQEVMFRVENIIIGNGEILPHELIIISPQERYGGISIAIGEPYRVLVVPISGKYYSWAATGSAPKDLAYSGFYKCP